MTNGKYTCRILKEIRRRIAEANGIEYVTSECRHKGECSGTCPGCEAEVRWLERQLAARGFCGRASAVVSLSAGLLSLGVSSSAACVAAGDVMSRAGAPSGVVSDSSKVSPRDGDKYCRLPEARGVKSSDGDDKVFGQINESWPEYPGGELALKNFIRETVDSLVAARGVAVDENTVCVSLVSFVVGADGYITKPKILKSAGDAFDRIAVDVVKSMPRWMPAQRNGNRINCKYNIAVRFGQGKRR